MGRYGIDHIGEAHQAAEPDRCCEADFGGSHYHCSYCGCTCSYQGHVDASGYPKWCTVLDKRPAYAARFADPDCCPLDAMAYNDRQAAALICGTAATDMVGWVSGLAPSTYPDVAASLGFGELPLVLALAAFAHALEYSAPNALIHEIDAEAEALLLGGWTP